MCARHKLIPGQNSVIRYEIILLGPCVRTNQQKWVSFHRRCLLFFCRFKWATKWIFFKRESNFFYSSVLLWLLSQTDIVDEWQKLSWHENKAKPNWPSIAFWPRVYGHLSSLIYEKLPIYRTTFSIACIRSLSRSVFLFPFCHAVCVRRHPWLCMARSKL